MKDEEILQILLDWNFWEKEQETGIERYDYINFIYPFLKTNQAIVITGVRRSGKSTIMLQLAKRLIDSRTDPRDVLIINFEDYRFYDVSLELLHKIYELYLKKVVGKTRIIFLDEIHKVTGWEKFVRTILDKKEAKIIVSGSNARLITEEYATLLTGRNIKILVFPLSFREFLLFKGLKLENKLKILAERIRIKKFLDEFLRYGGFPEVVLADEGIRRKISSDYIDGIITKDVVDRHKIREKAKLNALARYYLSNISNKISFNKLKDYLNIPLRTVERFSYYLEEAYVVSFLKRFSFKVKEQEKAARKVYSVDTGLCNVLGFRFSKDSGKIMENVVFLELMKINANNPNFEIYYWQDTFGKEVDFVIKQRLKIKQLIQVSYDIDDIDVKKRELKALTKASEELKCRNLLVITWDYESEEKVDNKEIRFVPLWKWLLATRN